MTNIEHRIESLDDALSILRHNQARRPGAMLLDQLGQKSRGPRRRGLEDADAQRRMEASITTRAWEELAFPSSGRGLG